MNKIILTEKLELFINDLEAEFIINHDLGEYHVKVQIKNDISGYPIYPYNPVLSVQEIDKKIKTFYQLNSLNLVEELHVLGDCFQLFHAYKEDLELLLTKTDLRLPVENWNKINKALTEVETLLLYFNEEQEDRNSQLNSMQNVIMKIAPQSEGQSKETQIEKIKLNLNQTQIVYLFEQLISEGYINTNHNDKLWHLISLYFIDKDNKELKSIHQTKSNLHNKGTGKPKKESEKIDKIVSSIKSKKP